MLDINHLEFPQRPRSGLADLFMRFCDCCRDATPAQGIDFETMKHQVAALYRSLTSPGGPRAVTMSANAIAATLVRRSEFAVWLNFRLTSMSAHIDRLAAVGGEAAAVHNPGLKLGIGMHLPAICPFVGTDLNLCGQCFDWVSPKFPDYLPASVIPLTAAAIATIGRFEVTRGEYTVFALDTAHRGVGLRRRRSDRPLVRPRRSKLDQYQ